MTRWLLTLALVMSPAIASADEAVENAEPSSGGGPQSPALIVTGVFMSASGIGGLIAGGVLISGSDGACSDLQALAEAASNPNSDTADLLPPTEGEISACQAEVNRTVAGGIALVTGGAFVLAGLPLLIVGATPSDDVAVSFEVKPMGATFSLEF